MDKNWDTIRQAVENGIADGDSEERLVIFDALVERAERTKMALRMMLYAFDPYGTGGDQFNGHGEAIAMAREILEEE